MLGGGDTTASVLVSSGGTDGNVAAASMVRGGGAVVAANVFACNGNHSNLGDDERVRVEEGEGFYGGNRWPRQETLALLKIRSDMDVIFRDASVKGPLWEEVSSVFTAELKIGYVVLSLVGVKKLAELGYHRSAKKCKEKFENVFKYHKRTKDSRTGKADANGKTYRFSDQLLALGTHLSVHSPGITAAAPPPQLKPQSQNRTTMAAVNNTPSQTNNVSVTDPSATTVVSSLAKNTVPTNINPVIPSLPNVSADLMSDSTSSDIELEGRRKRKRKWKGFFEKLKKQVVQEHEEMQKKFLQALEKREQDRMAREEAWRTQEIARLNRERELLAQERSIASAKDAALMALLQKFSDQTNPGKTQNNPSPQPAIAQAQPAAAAVPPSPLVPNLPESKTDSVDPSYRRISSRWPKSEVEALIDLRRRVENQFPDSVPKGSLWESISVAMQSLGYSRNAKRCKEKWENINKYFKKVQDTHKNRGDESKTCPYFQQLDALYRQKNKHDTSSNQFNSVPLMVLHEQPPPQSP